MTLFFFICIVLAASILQTSTGFGFSIIATPLLLLLFAPETAIQLNLVLSIMISLALVFKLFADINLTIVKRLVLGSLMGAPIGVAFLTLVAADVLKIVVGLLLIGVTGVLIKQLTLRQSSKRDGVVGFSRLCIFFL
ncbi:sulfite exporter TauE/SafE family protein [Shouchella patagoniensis]|uniref:sulfite exporter TauE/SafE family protein n=1 Tax=Shouchella patagoniensis TaxID=228576 RepID=UPI001473111A|nr:sulfite exporter TauE/SafE family protein [Shouchella patagoniensis]